MSEKRYARERNDVWHLVTLGKIDSCEVVGICEHRFEPIGRSIEKRPRDGQICGGCLAVEQGWVFIKKIGPTTSGKAPYCDENAQVDKTHANRVYYVDCRAAWRT
jgi:hypothetical protein